MFNTLHVVGSYVGVIDWILSDDIDSNVESNISDVEGSNMVDTASLISDDVELTVPFNISSVEGSIVVDIVWLFAGDVDLNVDKTGVIVMCVDVSW